MKNLLVTKSRECRSALVRGHASGPYSNTGKHLLFSSCRVTSFFRFKGGETFGLPLTEASHQTFHIFTTRHYVKHGICCHRVSVSVCLSVTLWYCIKTAKRRITQMMPHNSPGNLAFCCRKSRRNSNGITPYGSDKCSWSGWKLVTFDILNSEVTEPNLIKIFTQCTKITAN